MSVSTSEETPRARVRMCRWGWTAASSSVISPWRIRSSARLWSSVTWVISPSGEDVGPGVAHVGQRQHVPALGAAHQRHGRERGPHATQVGVDLALVPDRGVGLREGLAQPVDRRRPLEGLVERLDGDPGRHLAADVAAHAVGHRVEVRPLERQVLVDGADPPDVGGRARPQHRQRETSKTVEPIWSRSPLPSRTACVICSELTNVPLVEPRSSTQSWSLRRNRRACSVEV